MAEKFCLRDDLTRRRPCAMMVALRHLVRAFLFGPKHLSPAQPNRVAGRSPLATWAARSVLDASATSSKVAGGLLPFPPPKEMP